MLGCITTAVISMTVSRVAASLSAANLATAVAIAARRVVAAKRMALVATSASVLRLPRLVLAERLVAPVLTASVPTTRVAVPLVNVLNVSKRQDAALVRLVNNPIGFG